MPTLKFFQKIITPKFNKGANRSLFNTSSPTVREIQPSLKSSNRSRYTSIKTKFDLIEAANRDLKSNPHFSTFIPPKRKSIFGFSSESESAYTKRLLNAIANHRAKTTPTYSTA